MDRPAERAAIHYGALIAAQLAIGSAAILARYGLSAGLFPITLSAWRLAIAAVIIVGGLRLTSSRPSAPAPIPRFRQFRLVAAGLFLALHFVLWFASLELIPVARSTLLVTSGPVWTGLGGAIFLGHRLGARFWAGLAVAAIGVYLVTGVSGDANGDNSMGDLLALGGAVAIAAYLLLVQDLQVSVGTGRTVAWTYSSAGLAVWLLALAGGAFRVHLAPTNFAGWGGLAAARLLRRSGSTRRRPGFVRQFAAFHRAAPSMPPRLLQGTGR